MAKELRKDQEWPVSFGRGKWLKNPPSYQFFSPGIQERLLPCFIHSNLIPVSLAKSSSALQPLASQDTGLGTPQFRQAVRRFREKKSAAICFQRKTWQRSGIQDILLSSSVPPCLQITDTSCSGTSQWPMIHLQAATGHHIQESMWLHESSHFYQASQAPVFVHPLASLFPSEGSGNSASDPILSPSRLRSPNFHSEKNDQRMTHSSSPDEKDMEPGEMSAPVGDANAVRYCTI